jgi:hypothetical protein
MSKAEYETRRKALIDGATAVAANQSASASAKSTIFDRLGGASAAKPKDGSWSHDGFEELYGKQRAGGKAGGKAAVTKTIGKKVITKPGGKQTLSSRFEPYQAPHQRPTGDLRSKISKGGGKTGKAAATGVNKALPAKCPW